MACKLLGEEIFLGFGIPLQADVDTASASHKYWQTLPTTPLEVAYQKANDEGYTAKGIEFATREFKEAKTVRKTLPFLASSQLLCWLNAYAFGNVAVVGAADPYTYTAVPAVRGTDACELPLFSVHQIDSRGTPLLDQMIVGCAVAGFTLRLQSGPERANATVDVDILGRGRTTEPSAVAAPAAADAVDDLISASLAFSALGVDYVAAKRVNSLEFGWSNAAIARYAPGGGVQSGYALASSIELTKDRNATLTMNVDFASMAELNAVRDSTEGTVTITLTNSANDNWTVTLHRVVYGAYTFDEDQRGVNVQITGTPLWHTTNGLLTAVGKCDIAAMGQ